MNNELTEALVQALTESDNTISKYKQRFIDYCKDKVQDLGEMKIHSEEPYYDNGTVYQIYLIEPKFRDAEPAYCLNDEDEGALLVANEKGEIIFDGGEMAPLYAETLKMHFTKIATEYYEYMLEYWDDLDCDDILELADTTNTSKEKIEKELKVPDNFKYNIQERLGGADVEIYCPKYPDLKASTTTMDEHGKYVQEYFDIDGLWQVSTLRSDGRFKEYVYVTGWQEAIKVLEQEYNNITVDTPKPQVTTEKGTFNVEDYDAKITEIENAAKDLENDKISLEDYLAIRQEALKILHINEITETEEEYLSDDKLEAVREESKEA